MLPKLNALTAICAVALFFFPWLDVRCSGKPMIEQTGVQTAMGTYRLAEDARDATGDETRRQLDEAESRYAWLVGGALLCSVVGVLAAIAGVAGSRPGTLVSGVLAGAALAMLLLQDARGFPVERELMHAPDGDPGAAFARAMVLGTVEARRTPWFQVTLVALGMTAALGVGSALAGSKRRR